MDDKNYKKGEIMKHYLILLLLVTGFIFLPAGLNAQETAYAHISYVEADSKVIRADNTTENVVVNLPVVPGDKIITGEKSRCELQFDNGTVMRLGNNTQLQVTTILADSLTTHWKITTLHLQKGKIYTLNKSYNREKFQVITPNAAVKLKKNAIAVITVTPEGETDVFSKKGKFRVLLGKDSKALKTRTVTSGKGYTVTKNHTFTANAKKDIKFLSWNTYVDKNFDKLHKGISKVPKAIYRYNKAIVYFAEKFSSLYGEWVYDDLFGYVWKPAHENFARSHRPFFHADFVTINKQLYVVPQEKWAWAPAHLGTWVWMKSGWTWIPGNAFTPGPMQSPFHAGAEFGYSYHYPTFNFWMNRVFGDYDLYCTYRSYGLKRWRSEYKVKYSKTAKRPFYKDAPKNISRLMKRINKVSLDRVKNRIAKLSPTMRQPIARRVLKDPKLVIKKNRGGKRAMRSKPSTKTSQLAVSKRVKLTGKTHAQLTLDPMTTVKIDGQKDFRDWNPDKKWAAKNGVRVGYAGNQIVCPKLKVTSSKLNQYQKRALRRSNSRAIKSGNIRQAMRSGSNGGSSSTMGVVSTATRGRTAQTNSRASSVSRAPTGGKTQVK
ncbi:MAG: hypothetical protein GY757_13260 [bacterium]|nr:hypothetical protein [bacterium]